MIRHRFRFLLPALALACALVLVPAAAQAQVLIPFHEAPLEVVLAFVLAWLIKAAIAALFLAAKPGKALTASFLLNLVSLALVYTVYVVWVLVRPMLWQSVGFAPLIPVLVEILRYGVNFLLQSRVESWFTYQLLRDHVKFDHGRIVFCAVLGNILTYVMYVIICISVNS
ncbi:MAG: hypothetical protein D6E12_05165 [Desulfovibrio sp.]|nr:MAG: hypothetical protein D6E12_05165 [Desulfovibrio sp.]